MPGGSSAGGLAVLAKYGREYFVALARRSAEVRAERAKSNIMKELQTIVAQIADKARQNASWSTTIPNAITVGTVEYRDGNFYCNLQVDLQKAPQAAAFEYGSGLHSTKDTPEKYPIVPIHGKVLVIPRSRWPNYVPPPDVDPVRLRKVMHPGVEAKPYFQPAIQEMMPVLKQRLKSAFKRAFIGESFNA